MKKKILKKLLNNLPLKILSILIAIVIWYVVVSVNDPIVKERFDVPVQVTNEAYIAAGKKHTRLRRNTRRSRLLSRTTTRLSAG